MGADPANAENDRHQVIKLWLMRPRDMFELPQPDLFSEYRNFLTGVDFCLSELRGRVSFRPVRLEIYLPQAESTTGSPNCSPGICAGTAPTGSAITAGKHGPSVSRGSARCEWACHLPAGTGADTSGERDKAALRDRSCPGRSARLGADLDWAVVPARPDPFLSAGLRPGEPGAAATRQRRGHGLGPSAHRRPRGRRSRCRPSWLSRRRRAAGTRPVAQEPAQPLSRAGRFFLAQTF
jgi:hypothetical protein